MEIRLLTFIPSNYYLYLAVFISHIGVFIAATSMTWPSPVIPKLSNFTDNPLERIITTGEIGVLASIPIVGSLTGTFCSGYLVNKYGRKLMLTLLEIPALVSYLLMISPTEFWILYVARILGGFALGGVFTVDTMYFGEVSEDSNRGILGTAMTCFINFGLLFPLILGPITSFPYFHVVLSVFPVISIVLTILFVPESPHFLVLKNYEKAENALRILRGKDDVKKELNIIKENLENSAEISVRNVFSSRVLRRGLVIGCGLILFQQLSGTAVIMSYGQIIFMEAGNFVPSSLGPIIIVTFQFIVGFITPVFIEKSGRKKLLLLSYVGITVSHALFGFYFYVKSQDWEMVYGHIPWLPLLSLIIYIVTYSLGSGPIPWVMIGEIFPMEVKGIATSICITVCGISAFVLLMSYNFIVESIGLGYTFWIFSAFSLIATFFVHFFIVETRGKTLIEIQEMLSS